MNKLIKTSTGGRGNDVIQKYVNSLLKRYKSYTGTFSPPIDQEVLAKLQNAKIIYRKRSDHWVASIMPIGNGFVINVNESMSENRKRNAICHEIAHTFFFDTEKEPPRRLQTPRPDKKEEELCFWAAREMLVPPSLLQVELDRIGREAAYSFEGIKKLAETFDVSPDIIARRLTHDLAFLGNDWIVLWYSNPKKGKKLRPKSLYPSHISDLLSEYEMSKIREQLRSALEVRENEGPMEIDVGIGKGKKIRLKFRPEKVDREKLYAISWVSPLSGLE